MQTVVPYLAEYMDTTTAKKVAQDFLDQSYMVTQDKAKDAIEEEEGEDLCDCTSPWRTAPRSCSTTRASA